MDKIFVSYLTCASSFPMRIQASQLCTPALPLPYFPLTAPPAVSALSSGWTGSRGERKARKQKNWSTKGELGTILWAPHCEVTDIIATKCRVAYQAQYRLDSQSPWPLLLLEIHFYLPFSFLLSSLAGSLHSPSLWELIFHGFKAHLILMIALMLKLNLSGLHTLAWRLLHISLLMSTQDPQA